MGQSKEEACIHVDEDTYWHTIDCVTHNGLPSVTHTYTQPHPDTTRHPVTNPHTPHSRRRGRTHMGHTPQPTVSDSQLPDELCSPQPHPTPHRWCDTRRHSARQAVPCGSRDHPDRSHTGTKNCNQNWDNILLPRQSPPGSLAPLARHTLTVPRTHIRLLSHTHEPHSTSLCEPCANGAPDVIHPCTGAQHVQTHNIWGHTLAVLRPPAHSETHADGT